jgi:hypothetical protein
VGHLRQLFHQRKDVRCLEIFVADLEAGAEACVEEDWCQLTTDRFGPFELVSRYRFADFPCFGELAESVNLSEAPLAGFY